MNASTMKTVSMVAMILLIVGGLNWGLVGLFNYNLVTSLLGDGSLASKVVFDLVGLSAIYVAATAPKMMMEKSA